jgi:hypothetical protein
MSRQALMSISIIECIKEKYMNIRKLLTTIVTLFCLFTFGSFVQAQEQQAAPATQAPGSGHAGHAATPPADADHSGHDMGGKPGTGGQTAAKAQLDNLRISMEAIKASTNPEERTRLMQAHLAAMTTTLGMLKDAGPCPMMQSGMCPMMKNMQHGQGKDAKMEHGGSMGMGSDKKGMMAECHEKMQMKTQLTNGLLEHLIEMQGQLLVSSGK